MAGNRSPTSLIFIWTAFVATAAVFMLGAAGCGSSDDGTTTQPGVEAGVPPNGDSARPGPATGDDRSSSVPEAQGHDKAAKSPRSAAESLPAHSGGQAKETGDSPIKGMSASQYAAAIETGKKFCPAGTSTADCEKAVKGAAETKDGESTPVTAPHDCGAVMSQTECEALLTAQKAASEGKSVDVRECLENPTPECEALVRPILEQQQAAEAAAK